MFGLLKRVGLLCAYECGFISPSALTSSSTAAPMNSSMTMLRDKARKTGAGSERVSRVTRPVAVEGRHRDHHRKQSNLGHQHPIVRTGEIGPAVKHVPRVEESG